MATLSENGWPYLQHRGGPRGFLRVLNPALLAFADYQGNRQLLSTGNLAVNDRVTLFLMDYPNRTRLKIIGHARIEDAKEHPEYSPNSRILMSRAWWNVSFSSKSFRSIGTARNTSRPVTRWKKSKRWLLRSKNASRNSKRITAHPLYVT